MKRTLQGCFTRTTLIVAVALGGCGQLKTAHKELKVPPSGTIGVAELADRLGLLLRYESPYRATLTDRINSVMVFADPEGRAYVNGRPVGPAGGIMAMGRRLFVPAGLEKEIRSALRRLELTKAPPRPRPPPVPARVQLGPVVIDPGHGGKDPGAPGCNGLWEKDVVLQVGLATADILRERGVDVRMTRSDDRFIELNARAAMAASVGAKLFVSLHADAAPNRSARGFTVYAPAGRMEQAGALSSAMVRRLLATGLANRGVRPARFRVLVRTACPAVLVEMGYLSNAQDARLLGRPEFRDWLAECVAAAVLDYLTN